MYTKDYWKQYNIKEFGVNIFSTLYRFLVKMYSV